MSIYLGTTPVAAPHQSLRNIVDAFYPVGSIFIGTTSTCPLAAIKGTWTLKSSGRVLQGADSRHSAGTTIEAGLPNITGTVGTMSDAGNSRDSGALSWGFKQQSRLGWKFLWYFRNYNF